ncbi:8757_t:CDS:2, partial [Funneliformis mosseae]
MTQPTENNENDFSKWLETEFMRKWFEFENADEITIKEIVNE